MERSLQRRHVCEFFGRLGDMVEVWVDRPPDHQDLLLIADTVQLVHSTGGRHVGIILFCISSYRLARLSFAVQLYF